ncbi:MAG: hypothetical protein KGJ13_04760 [Patescibacteria group bacterium]|nr:hypothetical protein [Patescibacteria group bacterium]
MERALRMAGEGKKPNVLDNSPFTRIARPGQFVGEQVVELEFSANGYCTKRVLIFRMNGEPIPCEFSYPLSYVKWEPESEFAKYSITK